MPKYKIYNKGRTWTSVMEDEKLFLHCNSLKHLLRYEPSANFNTMMTIEGRILMEEIKADSIEVVKEIMKEKYPEEFI